MTQRGNPKKVANGLRESGPLSDEERPRSADFNYKKRTVRSRGEERNILGREGGRGLEKDLPVAW